MTKKEFLNICRQLLGDGLYEEMTIDRIYISQLCEEIALRSFLGTLSRNNTDWLNDVKLVLNNLRTNGITGLID